MKQLKVTKIAFLNSGKISVEVFGENENNPPIPPALDNVRMRLYMDYAETDTVEKVKEAAIRIAQDVMRPADQGG